MFTEQDNAVIQANYDAAKKRYAELGIDTDSAMSKLAAIPISLHCWQGDDVKGFEVTKDAASGGGIMSTGNYCGPATDGQMLRQDMEKAFSLIPGQKRCNLHAIYAETDGEVVSRDELKPQHFAKWMKWSKEQGIALDFNPTYFAHKFADDGYTLSNASQEIRDFWIRHGIACRKIAQAFGENQNGPCYVNHWIPDGAKDQPADRQSPRQRLIASYDEIMRDNLPLCIDGFESKLFGIGSEDYVVGSHEFYMGYCLNRNHMLTLDMGHFHPTETIHDKISALLLFQKELLVHVSRGIRWDSDHVVNFNEDLRNLALQIVRCQATDRIHLALDFFDGSINRIAAWVTGTRATQKAMLSALLDPTAILQRFDAEDDRGFKLALQEEMRTYPLGAVWDMYCLINHVPTGSAWLENLLDYDRNVIRKR